MSKLHKAALYYASTGLEVFPLRPGTKKPATPNGFKDATSDANKINHWWGQNADYNIGIPGDSIGLVIDVDPRNGGNESLVDFKHDFGLPATVLVETGGDGLHYWYTTPGSVVQKFKLPRHPGIDIQGAGSYVVAPPSIHESGKEYKFASEHELGNIPPQPAPPKLLAESMRLESEKARRVKQSNPATAGPISLADLHELRIDLLRCDPRMTNDDWIAIGMALHSTGWPGMFELWDEWSSGGMHDFLVGKLNYPGTRELRFRWDSFKPGGGKTISTIKYYAGRADVNFVAEAIHYHSIEDTIERQVREAEGRPSQEEEEYMMYASIEEELQRESDEFERTLEMQESYTYKAVANTQAPDDSVVSNLTMRSPAEFMDIAPPKWRTDSLWPETGLAALFGPSGVGKTFLILEDMLAAYTGTDFLGCENPKTSGSVYVCLEGNVGVRLLAALQHHNVAPGDALNRIGVLSGALSLNDSTEASILSEALFDYKADGGQFQTVYIDTMARAFGGGDENSSADMGNVIREAQSIAQAHECLVVLVHHTGKNEAAGLRGHSSLFAACDTVVSISGEQHGTKAVEIVKQKDADAKQLNSYDLEVAMLEPSSFTHGQPMRDSERTTCVVVESEPSAPEPAPVNQENQDMAVLVSLVVASGGRCTRQAISAQFSDECCLSGNPAIKRMTRALSVARKQGIIAVDGTGRTAVISYLQ